MKEEDQPHKMDKSDENKTENEPEKSTIKEGKAIIAFCGPTFYNPVQEFNRDLTVSALRQFVRARLAERAKRNELKDQEENVAKAAEPAPKKKKIQIEEEDGSIRILDALSATGLRAIRFSKEVPCIASITANDFSENAVESIKKNVELNGLQHLVTPHFGDATMTMMEHRGIDKRFHCVDLDPYGSASQFLDAAVQSVADRGMLMVTCTDMAVLCGNTPEACFNKYDSIPIRMKSCHEMALRILLRAIETHANRYARYIEPLVSISVDFYVRVFVRMHTGAREAKNSAVNVGRILCCSGCHSFEVLPIIRKFQEGASLRFTPAIAKSDLMSHDQKCVHCESPLHEGGPIYTGPIHNQEFLRGILDDLTSTAEGDRLGTHDRLLGILTEASEELPDVSLYYHHDQMSNVVKCVVPKIVNVRSAILNAGYRVSGSHANPRAIKTDAPTSLLWDICRYVAKESNVKVEKMKDDLPGKKILQKPIGSTIDFKLHKGAESRAKLDQLVRFQCNRGKNWGPKPKAKGSVNSVKAGFQASCHIDEKGTNRFQQKLAGGVKEHARETKIRMTSMLSSFFSRDSRPQFPFDLTAPPFHTNNGISMCKSHKKGEIEEKVTLFAANITDLAASSLKLHAQKLKTMRHPGILTFIESAEIDGKFYLVTEPCLPLSAYFDDTSINAEQKEFIVSWGVYQVLSTLKFLHQANVSHEMVRMSIYVTPAGDWKLGNMGSSGNFKSCRTDLNQLAIAMWEVFNGFKDDISKPEPPGRMPKRLHDLYKKMATAQVEKYGAEELIRESRNTGGFFKNRFVDTLLFLEEFQLKEAHEKQAFFTNLRDHLAIFPDGVAKYKILPKLILSYEFGDAGPNILIPLFKLGHLLDEQEYQRKIVPCLVKLFSSPDRTTRVKLLERIDEFASHLTPQVVNEKIFANLATGFMDTSPAVRETTVKAMVSLAEKLNVHNLNTELMKHLARLQGTDEHGGIRTNTTICLGKIGGFLEPSNRQKILIGAFTRGLKDPFPPARMAAVLALSATQQFYSLVEVANRIVPALGPMTCDPEKQVRDQAFKSIKGFLEKLEKASENPEIIPELEAQVKAGGRGFLDSDKVPQWASWALKSLSGKFYKGAPPPTNTTTGTAAKDDDSAQAQPNVESGATLQASSALKPKVLEPTRDAEGWGSFEDEDEENDDSDVYTDARESISQHGKKQNNDNNKNGNEDNDDDWGTGWEKEMSSGLSGIELNRATTTSTAPALKKPIKSKMTATTTTGGGGGGLKLGGGSGQDKMALKGKELDNQDLDFLLGITNTPRDLSTKTAGKKATTSNTAATSAGGSWEIDDDPIGNNDFDEWGSTTVMTKAPPKLAPPPAVSSSASLQANREARRAEIAAKNEAKRREIAEKRAQQQKGIGGGKVPTKTPPAANNASTDGWEDF
ncbi:unnamed protein product, partial [Mesorhabditis belari]|uniref:tRNA (guanine(26)-N(2))-dimethyltransferase n=1 Tax=Mesorhabditis belari TaxID=2138241 RepID=A0AAF3ELN7_9BILA